MKDLEMRFEANEWSPFGGNVDDGKKKESVANDQSQKGKRRKTVCSKSKFVFMSTANSLIQHFIKDTPKKRKTTKKPPGKHKHCTIQLHIQLCIKRTQRDYSLYRIGC